MLREFSISWVSELKKLLPKQSVEIVGNEIDWDNTNLFHKNIIEEFFMEFTNVKDGTDITITLQNASSSAVPVIFPSGVLVAGAEGISLPAGVKNIFNFFCVNGQVFGAITHNTRVRL